MARKRHSVHPGGRDRFEIAHAIAEREDEPAHRLGGVMVGELEDGDLVGGDRSAQPVAGMHEEVGRVDHVRMAGDAAQCVGEERRDLEGVLGIVHLAGAVVLPAGGADARGRGDLGREQVGEAAGVARLRDQRENRFSISPARVLAYLLAFSIAFSKARVRASSATTSRSRSVAKSVTPPYFSI